MSSPSIFGECVFFDVGQGTANIIFLRDRRAILIDVGPVRNGVVRQFLSDYNVSSIECVVLSHNDDDHIRGWEEIAKRFGDRIKEIYLLQDRPIKKKRAFDLTMCLAEQGVIPRPIRAEVRNLGERKKIWEDPALGMSVSLLYPDMLASVRAAEARRPNRACAIVLLECSGRKILFAGDSTREAWRELYEHSGGVPIVVDILAVPHHGGLSRKDASSDDVKWLYRDAIRSTFAVVSVGTANRYDHPRRELVDALHSGGAHVMCTQLTSKCHQLDLISHGVLAPGEYSSCVVASTQKQQPAVGCAGTMVAALGHDGIEIDRHEEHRKAVVTLSNPMCRPEIAPV